MRFICLFTVILTLSLTAYGSDGPPPMLTSALYSNHAQAVSQEQERGKARTGQQRPTPRKRLWDDGTTGQKPGTTDRRKPGTSERPRKLWDDGTTGQKPGTTDRQKPGTSERPRKLWDDGTTGQKPGTTDRQKPGTSERPRKLWDDGTGQKPAPPPPQERKKPSDGGQGDKPRR